MDSTPFRQGKSLAFRIKESKSGPHALRLTLDGFEIESDKITIQAKNGRLKITKNTWRPWNRPKETSKKYRCREGSIWVTRGWPKASIGLWLEVESKRYRPILNVEHRHDLASDASPHWSDFDKFYLALKEKCIELGVCGLPGVEYGEGQHRVVLFTGEDSIQIYARPLFRERHELVFEVLSDSLFRIAKKSSGVRKMSESSVVDVLLTGDRIRMVNQDGDDIESLSFPWISPEDRRNICQKLQTFFDDRRHEEKPSRPRTATNDILLKLDPAK